MYDILYDKFVEWLNDNYNEVEKSMYYNYVVQNGTYPQEFLDYLKEES